MMLNSRIKNVGTFHSCTNNKRSVRCASSKAPVDNVQEFPTYLQFAEKLNGRAAQQGFIWGAVNEAYTGNDVKDQLFSVAQNGSVDLVSDDILNLVLVVGAISLGTAITTIIPNKTLEYKSRSLAPQFTEDAELLNGRLAMLGFVALSVLN
jgi:hypothetical protein